MEHVLIKFGLPDLMVKKIMNCVTMVSFSIIINGSPRENFSPNCGLRQGDPLSPYLFILRMECLSGLVRNEECRGGIVGINVANKAPKISHLFFLLMTQLSFYKGMRKMWLL